MPRSGLPYYPLRARGGRKYGNAMAFIPVPEVTEAILHFSLDGQLVENTLYFVGAGDDTIGANSVAGQISAWAAAQLLPLLCDDIVLDFVQANNLTTSSSATSVAPSGESGSIVEEPVPNNVCACVSFRTGIRGRSFRGRNYVAAIPNSEVTLNTMSSTLVTNLTNAYNELLPAGGALDGLTWVVVSRFSGVDGVTGKPIPRTTGIFTLVESVLMVDAIVDSQRRRLPGRGR